MHENLLFLSLSPLYTYHTALYNSRGYRSLRACACARIHTACSHARHAEHEVSTYHEKERDGAYSGGVAAGVTHTLSLIARSRSLGRKKTRLYTKYGKYNMYKRSVCDARLSYFCSWSQWPVGRRLVAGGASCPRGTTPGRRGRHRGAACRISAVPDCCPLLDPSFFLINFSLPLFGVYLYV